MVYGGTIDPRISDNKYLEYGSKFVYIAQMSGKTPEDLPYFGSGVAIHDNIILTAAHVVDHMKSCSVKINNKTINIRQSIVHPKYIKENFGNYDIALCLLENDIKLDWYPELYSDNNEAGKVCSLAGYGVTGNFVTGVTRSDNKLRAGSNMIDYIDKGLLICAPSVVNKTELEFCISAGDSGGGLFIGNKLAGIHSCVIESMGDKGKSKYGTLSGHTRVSLYKDWIVSTIKNLVEKK